DQSIYAFRGARVGNMADFVREFNVQHQIKLEQNYRSHSNILDSANALIAHNKRRLGKNLRTDAGAGEPVRVYEAPSDFAEAEWVVDELRQLVKGEAYERKEIAILYRSNAQSRVIETQLFNAGVPYRVYGGLRFFERAEVKHALAYLRLLENPRDDTSFLRVVNFPPRGIGARTLEQLQDAARAAGTSLVDAVSSLPGRAGANLSAFVAKIDVLREQTAGCTLREIIEQMLETSGLIEHYRADREGADRIENLEELASAAESFVTQEGFGRDAVALPVDETAGLTQSPVSQGLDPEGPMLDAPLPLTPALSPAGRGSQQPGAADSLPLPLAGEGRGEGGASLAPDAATGETLSPLAAFLTHAALEAGDNQAQAGQDAVQLMTVHASKGLEFDAVFITGLEEGLFPHENAMSDMDGLEEERRLMYVAITRARKRLYLSHAQTRMLHGQTRYHIRSRFLEELPEDALKWITPRRSGFADIAASVSGAAGARPAWGTSALDSSFAAAPLPPRKAAPAHGIAAGQQVFHNKFGEGKVLAVEGAGDDARAQVSFPRHGVKWLALAVAKLTVVD
ncbi:MAG TPA: 3'-5' exonuclease, partial [Ottowia beijingensis]|nr:3'-5' exonuclease [Ottowia beijingensis]